MAFFTITYISVSRTNCVIIFNELTTSEVPAAAILWDSSQQVSSSELVLRSMWLSLATKAMEEKWKVSVGTDSAGLATFIEVLDTNTAGSSISLPTTEQQRAELIQKLLNQRKQSLVESPSTVP